MLRKIELPYVLALSALILNGINYLVGLDYLWSTMFVFGGLSAILTSSFVRYKKIGIVSWDDVKLFFVFFMFSNISTLAIELLMLKFDVWGFSHRVYYLTGHMFIGAPVEEYVYWAFCPVVVALTYIGVSRSSKFKLEAGGTELPCPMWLLRIAEYLKYLQGFTQNPASSAKVDYIEPTEVDGTTYKQGAKYPAYLGVQIAIIFTMLALASYYHGSRKSLAWTALCFLLLAFPHEYYTLTHGFWVYNSQKILGWYFAHVPLEGWVMYIISPVCGCMMLDFADKKLFNKDV